MHDDTVLDDSRKIRIQTAGSKSSIDTLGRADIGILQHSVVANSDDVVTNLVSVPELDRRGYTINFQGGMATVSKNKKIIMKAPLTSDNLYLFDIRIFTECEESAMLGNAQINIDMDVLHDRLGHRSKQSIRHAIKNKLITVYNRHVLEKRSKGSNCICGPCAIAKATKYPKQRRTYKGRVMAVAKEEVDHLHESDEDDRDGDDSDSMELGTNHNEPAAPIGKAREMRRQLL